MMAEINTNGNIKKVNAYTEIDLTHVELIRFEYEIKTDHFDTPLIALLKE